MEGHGKMARRPVTIDVTPKLVQNTPQGTIVVCEIDQSGGGNSEVKGGIIKLKKTNDYKLTFKIQPGDVPGLQFDANGPFWCDTNSCPGGPGNNSNGQLKNPQIDPTDPTVLTVDADPDGTKNAVHYSLNFNNNGRFDPVIIHE